MDTKTEVTKYKQYLSDLDPRPMQMNSPAYSRWIGQYLEDLCSLPMEKSLACILDLTQEYTVHFARQEQGSSKKLSPDPILGDVEWAIDTTLKNSMGKRERYQALLTAPFQKNLAELITNTALTLPREDGISFVGGLIGTWMLVYPVQEIGEEEKIAFPSPWAVEDEDYTFILRRSLEINFLEWRR